jgi:glutamate-1-semialdehyde 2,1-aminomutase
MENLSGMSPAGPVPPDHGSDVRVYGMTAADPILGEFLRRTPGSAAESRKARAVLPLGVSSNFRYYDPYPLVIARGQGCHLWDVDGHRYIDYNLAQGTMVVGYAHPEIVRAVEAAAASGSMFSLPAASDRQMAELLCARFPVDQVRFTTTGSEAVMYALRLARGVTRRDAFIRFEGAYHGTYDPLLGGFRPRPEHAGPIEAPRPDYDAAGLIPGALRDTLVATYNHIDSVRRHFQDQAGRVAAVIVEPVVLNYGLCPPQPGFLEELRRLCDEHGALLIFDEVKTGIKLAHGGACEHFGIRPDIVCLAKSIGGGLPLGAFGARRELMDFIARDEVLHTGTYCGNRVSLAAGIATLGTIMTPEVYPRLHRLSARLQEGYQEVIRRHRLAAHVERVGPFGTLWLGTTPVRTYRDFLAYDDDRWMRFYLAMINAGVLPGPPGQDDVWTLSVAHDEEAIETTIRAFDRVAPSLR